MVLGASNGFFYDGYFMTIIGQSTFIAAYSMLVFLARLQRFDPGLEEAALDLGATQTQVFRKILLPFLKPAIGSAAVLAFLASFENYNTTVFTIVSESTLTTVLASKVRYGINPSISSLAVIIIALTLVGAVAHEYLKRKEARAIASGGDDASVKAPAKKGGSPSRSMMRIPVGAISAAVVVGLLGSAWMARNYDVGECKVRVAEENRVRFEALKQQRLAEAKAKQAAAAGGQSTAVEANQAARQYQNIFAPSNLGQQVDSQTENQMPDQTMRRTLHPRASTKASLPRPTWVSRSIRKPKARSQHRTMRPAPPPQVPVSTRIFLRHLILGSRLIPHRVIDEPAHCFSISEAY